MGRCMPIPARWWCLCPGQPQVPSPQHANTVRRVGGGDHGPQQGASARSIPSVGKQGDQGGGARHAERGLEAAGLKPRGWPPWTCSGRRPAEQHQAAVPTGTRTCSRIVTGPPMPSRPQDSEHVKQQHHRTPFLDARLASTLEALNRPKTARSRLWTAIRPWRAGYPHTGVPRKAAVWRAEAAASSPAHLIQLRSKSPHEDRPMRIAAIFRLCKPPWLCWSCSEGPSSPHGPAVAQR